MGKMGMIEMMGYDVLPCSSELGWSGFLTDWKDWVLCPALIVNCDANDWNDGL